MALIVVRRLLRCVGMVAAVLGLGPSVAIGIGEGAGSDIKSAEG